MNGVSRFVLRVFIFTAGLKLLHLTKLNKQIKWPAHFGLSSYIQFMVEERDPHISYADKTACISEFIDILWNLMRSARAGLQAKCKTQIRDQLITCYSVTMAWYAKHTSTVYCQLVSVLWKYSSSVVYCKRSCFWTKEEDKGHSLAKSNPCLPWVKGIGFAQPR